MSQHDSRGITAPLGFRAAGMHCGIKKRGLLDLALVVSEVSGPIAGVFTTNQVVAAPVTLDRQHLRHGLGRAILINSGNANACTGRQGMAAARKTGSARGHADWAVPLMRSSSVRPASSAVPLPVDRIVKALPALFDRSAATAAHEAARAIMTTDLKPKSVRATHAHHGRTVTIGGMAKGSGMIHPDMATMLAYLTTDAAITRAALQRALRQAADQSFNCISVDGDTSTNDTVLCLANGMAGNRQIREGTAGTSADSCALLTEACQPLALAICRDGEGVTKVVKIDVDGARQRGASPAGGQHDRDIQSGQDGAVRRGCQLGTGDGSPRPCRGAGRSHRRSAFDSEMCHGADAGLA